MRKVSSFPEHCEVGANFFFTALAARLIADTTASSSLSESESDDSGDGHGEGGGWDAAFFVLVPFFFELVLGVVDLEAPKSVTFTAEDRVARVLAI